MNHSRLAAQRHGFETLLSGELLKPSRRSLLRALTATSVCGLTYKEAAAEVGSEKKAISDNQLVSSTPREIKPLWQTLPPTPTLPPPSLEGRLVTEGADIYYAQFGEGPSVLMLHGGLASSCYWGNQVRALCQNYRITVMDTRGHGRSSLISHRFSYSQFARDVVNLLDHLRIPKTSIIGWSDGGITGLQLACTAPARVARLFAFGANTNASGLQPQGTRSSCFLEFGERCRYEYRQISPQPASWATLVLGLREMWRKEPNMAARELACINVPVIISQGEYDEIIRADHGLGVASAIPGAKFLLQPGVSHFAMLQEPRRFSEFLYESLFSV